MSAFGNVAAFMKNCLVCAKRLSFLGGENCAEKISCFYVTHSVASVGAGDKRKLLYRRLKRLHNDKKIGTVFASWSMQALVKVAG